MSPPTAQARKGTYKLGVLAQPTSQQFAVSLPASVSNGVPSAGAGNLETTASEDVYAFTTAAGGVQLDFSTCASTLGAVDWKLVNKTSGAVVASGQTCTSKLVTGVPAAAYLLKVSRNGSKGTYKLAIKKS